MPQFRMSPPEQETFDLCSLSELKSAGGLAFSFWSPMEHRIAVFWDGYDVYATDDYCPHAFVSLAHSRIEPQRVTCSSHSAVFSLKTGECLDRYTHDLRVYKAEVRNGRVVVHAPGLRRIVEVPA